MSKTTGNLATSRPARGGSGPPERTAAERGIKTSPELRFYEEVLGLDYLNYGLWDGDPLTRDGLRAAQERYAEELCNWIPQEVRSILDVGCGTGEKALKLKQRGFDVEGLSPDPHQQEQFTRKTGLPFHLAKMENFEPGRRYDLVQMSESSQYIPLERLFPGVLQSAPGGYLLVCDYFSLEGDDPPSKSGHPFEGFLEQSRRHGLELLRSEDITDGVLPTLDLARQWLESYAVPTLEIARDLAQRKYPRILRLVLWIFGRQGRKLTRLRRKLDRQEFKRYKRYERMLFRVPGEA